MLTVILFVLFLILLSFAIAMTVLYVKQKRHKPMKLCESRECLRSAANLALSMDPTADPCDDFYQYVCGNWAEDHPRPDAYRSYDWFRDKQTKVYTMVRDFLAKNITSHHKPVQQAKIMYDSCMDTDTIDKRGLKPVLQILDSLGLPLYPTFINATEDFDYSSYSFDWVDTVIKIKTKMGMDVLIGFDIFTDPKNSSVYKLVMGSPETTNPFPSIRHDKKRHNYQKNINQSPRIPKHYQDETIPFNNDDLFESKAKSEDKAAQAYKLLYAEVIKLFVIDSGAAKDTSLTEIELDQHIFLAANEYFDFNNDLYDLESDNETDTNKEELYLNIPEYTVDELQAHTDEIVESNNNTASPIWKRYLEGVFNISKIELDFENDKILVSASDLRYMSLMASYVARSPPVVIELYIWIKVVEVMASHTTIELRTLFHRSHDEIRHRGYTSTPPRSLQCASAVNDMLGLAVAYAIADPHFYNVTKPKIQDMLWEMKKALAQLVSKARWMDDDTKIATYQKIVNMKTLIGFPDWLLEEGRLESYYEGVEIDPEKHLENMINIIQVKVKKVLNKFRENNNFTWATDPTEVNAYHTFQENTITPLITVH
ncbi:endothelin-converting enzyme 2-like [Hyposmocoma kahamanoa]|uniref:endothelin-converting enzyme 2-like n=1 Tax=Hyposmocoma kahamanoa TaxID=1477025 RepID=UPI000E6D5C1C|nr:endothelin-converting enzyme 2-like [Hyposmocoma kahamanoa]